MTDTNVANPEFTGPEERQKLINTWNAFLEKATDAQIGPSMRGMVELTVQFLKVDGKHLEYLKTCEHTLRAAGYAMADDIKKVIDEASGSSS